MTDLTLSPDELKEQVGSHRLAAVDCPAAKCWAWFRQASESELSEIEQQEDPELLSRAMIATVRDSFVGITPYDKESPPRIEGIRISPCLSNGNTYKSIVAKEGRQIERKAFVDTMVTLNGGGKRATAYF